MDPKNLFFMYHLSNNKKYTSIPERGHRQAARQPVDPSETICTVKGPKKNKSVVRVSEKIDRDFDQRSVIDLTRSLMSRSDCFDLLFVYYCP